MPTTASGIWYPDGNFTANPRVVAAQQAANLESVIASERLNHGSTEYATEAARDAAITSPKQGMECTVNGNPMVYRTSTGWGYVKTLSYPLINSPTRLAVYNTSMTSPASNMGVTPFDLGPATYSTRVLFVFTVMVSSLSAGYAYFNLLVNSSVIVALRVTQINHTASSSFLYNLAANTTINVSVTGQLSSGSATAVVSNSNTYSYLQYTVLPA